MRRCAADHNTLLNRKAGYTGTHWHAHPHHEDGMGLTTKVPALGQVRSLVYPEGFGAGKLGNRGIAAPRLQGPCRDMHHKHILNSYNTRQVDR